MLKSILSLFTDEIADATPAIDRVQAASAALLVEAAMTDGRFAPSERAMITRILCEHHGLDEQAADALIDETLANSHDVASFHQMTHIIKQSMDHAERVKLIEHLWQVADADGDLHDFEHSLIRRVAGLLYVDDRTRASARNKNG